MDYKELSEFSPSIVFYNLKDKLTNHVAKRSFDAFDRADCIRNNIKSKEEFLNYKEKAKKTLSEIVGEIPYDKKLPLDAKITGVIEENDIIIEKIIFTSRKNIYVTANLYLPKNENKKHPVILMQMGHSAVGKAGITYQKGARIHAKAGFARLLSLRNFCCSDEGYRSLPCFKWNHRKTHCGRIYTEGS